MASYELGVEKSDYSKKLMPGLAVAAQPLKLAAFLIKGVGNLYPALKIAGFIAEIFSLAFSFSMDFYSVSTTKTVRARQYGNVNFRWFGQVNTTKYAFGITVSRQESNVLTDSDLNPILRLFKAIDDTNGIPTEKEYYFSGDTNLLEKTDVSLNSIVQTTKTRSQKEIDNFIKPKPKPPSKPYTPAKVPDTYPLRELPKREFLTDLVPLYGEKGLEPIFNALRISTEWSSSEAPSNQLVMIFETVIAANEINLNYVRREGGAYVYALTDSYQMKNGKVITIEGDVAHVFVEKVEGKFIMDVYLSMEFRDYLIALFQDFGQDIVYFGFG